LETFRRGIAEYGVPREMLTDNGRQYTNWRGKTRFEQEMKKDRVKHIRSRPHHPMTLGKIERFWQSILSEFLQRAQFTSFEDAAGRIAFWVKYYNYKRPHQGIGGLCPADRFFEIDTALKKTLEQGVEENALELALRGKPRDPFYMVGRMGDQSVVIRAEKGRVKMLVDDNQELVYDTERGSRDEGKTNPPGVRPETKDHRRIVHLDGAKEYQSDLPGDVGQLDPDRSVAKPGHGGDDRGPVAEETAASQAIEPQAATVDRQENPGWQSGQTGKAVETDPDQSQLMSTGADDGSQKEDKTEQGHGASPADHEGALRADDGRSGRRPAGRIAQDLL
jgi:hypothetical protein